MKVPEPIKIDTPDHRHILEYAKHLAARFDISLGAALGLLLKLDNQMRTAADSPEGMINVFQ